MEKLFFQKTGCRCALKLQTQEELNNPRCIRCWAVAEKKAKQDYYNTKIDMLTMHLHPGPATEK